jgi:hypothetical protein
MSSTGTATATELASREADGVRVTLQWYRHEGFASVVVEDSRSGEAFELVLSDADNALDVFHHPFAYAAYRGLLAHGSANEPALSVAA